LFLILVVVLVSVSSVNGRQKSKKGKELGGVIQKNENIAHNCFDWFYKSIVHNKYFV